MLKFKTDCIDYNNAAWDSNSSSVGWINQKEFAISANTITTVEVTYNFDFANALGETVLGKYAIYITTVDSNYNDTWWPGTVFIILIDGDPMPLMNAIKKAMILSSSENIVDLGSFQDIRKNYNVNFMITDTAYIT